MSRFLVTFIGGDYTVTDRHKAAVLQEQGNVLHVQEMPTEPEDWHEIDEQYMHTLG